MQIRKFLQRNPFKPFSAAVSPKFPLETPVGQLKSVAVENPLKDAVRFNSQDYNWTYKELDTYSSAFAFGLMENGFVPGERLLLWVDLTASAEILVAQLGALKAGLSIVLFEGATPDAALESSGAEGLLFSPDTQHG